MSSGGSSMGGASAGGASAGGGVATGGVPTNQFPCLNPSPILDATTQIETGYEVCENRETRRVRQVECPSSVPRAEPVTDFDPTNDECQFDSDCTVHANGYCAVEGSGFDRGPSVCSYGCKTDSDCAPSGVICVCPEFGPIGYCVPATCTSSADCLPGFDCLTHEVSSTCGAVGFACQMPGDPCGTRGDCGGGICSAVTGGRQCSTLPGCAIGRPFLVHGSERVAPCDERQDWLDVEIEPSLLDHSAELRARLAHEWARAGQMEHASIAAFARFALQLMSLGAPPALIERATQAMADETAHAKLCFALASRYRGKSVGPGALVVEGSLDAMSTAEIVELTIREGCIGETVAAIEATEAAEHASDPVVRAALRRIAADETRHAELAWRFVSWAIEQNGSEIALLVEREFSELLRGVEPALAEELSIEDQHLLARGVVPQPLRDVLRARALREVVEPCVRALAGRQSLASSRKPLAEGLERS
jgi:hypothetical protein